MKPSKPEDYPLMWVWSYERENAVKRRVLWIYDGGGCEVLIASETDVIYYNNCEEIKEPEYMTREQAVCFLAQNPTYVARVGDAEWSNRVAFSTIIDRYEWTTTDGYKYGEPRKFTTDYLEAPYDD